ncbi:MAG: cytochrome c oxidase subunit II [Actinobacteria bacterium]|uniref:cytochrome-c oxidase n=1 Tax=freshwater metagenome TaxID=449393 RepID=A0A6J6VBQ7_9ZZZZ|nr:cytochrome c oxidase subunit II [Actinomycetota bacterium]MSZ04989.1 cytochrome c oxidase subunit II [Actinomycetota bacterium]MTB06623.1 cytochrome c oxidase subunit II [Actinomycetota bacterium]
MNHDTRRTGSPQTMTVHVETRQTVARRTWRRVAGGTALLGGALLLSSCSRNSPQDTWKPKGDSARKIDNLQRPVFLVAGIVGVIVFLVVGYAVTKFRDKGQPIPKQSHGKPALEIVLTIIPFVILATIGAFTARTIVQIADTKGCEMTVNVTGQQWWWEYAYPATAENQKYGITKPIVTSGELVIPAGTCVLLRETSRDVIHSFWIPALNGKKDAVPGRVHENKLEADAPGYFAGQCTEFCGLSHANMRQWAIALNEEDFATWVQNQQRVATVYAETDDSPEALGYRAFRQNCSRCHQVNGMQNADGTPTIAAPENNIVAGSVPNLTHLMTRSRFAGETFPLLNKTCTERLTKAASEQLGAVYLEGVTSDCLNRTQLEAWLRNAPGEKPMYVKPDAKGLLRGMPNLGLSEKQIDSIVTYLQTLK